MIASVALSLAAVQPASAAPYNGPYQLGQTGPGVLAIERSLVAARVRPRSLAPTRRFGLKTRYEVRRFQRAKHIPDSGVIGRPTFGLLPFDAYGRYLLGVAYQRHLRAVARAKEAARIVALAKQRDANRINLVLEATRMAASSAYLMSYSQGWSRSALPAWPSVPTATDCSGYATWVLWHAGVFPGGTRIVGWTGTLGVQGVAVSGRWRVGDLVFYGSYPYSHVAVYVGSGLVSSHGSPGIHVLSAFYRTVGAVRRFW